MKFNRDFINKMDGTGRLLLAFNNVSMKKNMCVCMLKTHLTNVQCIYSNRLLVLLSLQRRGSSVSLLSGGLSRLQRPHTSNTIPLPTVCSPQPGNETSVKDLCLSHTPDQSNAGGEKAFCKILTI